MKEEVSFTEGRLFFVKGKSIVIDEWTDAVAKKIMEYLNNSEPIAKTIGFCVDIEHEELIDLAGFDDFIENWQSI